MSKPKPRPVNIKPSLKKFIFKQKGVLSDKFDKYFSEGAVLEYYLNGSEEFLRDFEDYNNGKVNKEEDLLKLLTK